MDGTAGLSFFVRWLVIFTLIGCGDKHTTVISTKLSLENLSGANDSWGTEFAGHIPHSSVVQATNLRCHGQQQSCLPSVGQVISNFYPGGNVTRMGACTGYVIHSDYGMSSTHCFPPNLRVAGARCAGFVSIIFPRIGGYPAEAIGCGTILFVTPTYTSHRNGDDSDNFSLSHPADYIIFSLQRTTTRPPLVLSRAGFRAGEEFSLHAVETNADYVPRRCRAIQTKYELFGSNILPQPYSARFQLTGCEIGFGNSGGAVIDYAGYLRGIVNQKIRNGRPRGDPFGVNLACVEVPGLLRGPLPASCRR